MLLSEPPASSAGGHGYLLPKVWGSFLVFVRKFVGGCGKVGVLHFVHMIEIGTAFSWLCFSAGELLFLFRRVSLCSSVLFYQVLSSGVGLPGRLGEASGPLPLGVASYSLP